MTPEPLVAVVIPLFNRRSSILEAVDGALDQTYPAVEVVVVDDGSSDGGGELVRTRAETDPRLRVLFQDNRGPSAARNAGIRAAEAPFVTFLDSDDLMVPERIRAQMDYLTGNPGVDAVLCQGRIEVSPGIDPPLIAKFSMRNEEPTFQYTSVLVAKHHLELVGGFDESLRIAEDLDLLVRLRSAGIQVGRLDKVLMVTRFFGDNLSYETGGAHLFAVLRKHLEAGRD